MQRIWPVVLLAGCDTLADLFPEPRCEDRVAVDALTGAAELVLDPSDCDRDGLVPTRAVYELLLDEDWEPLVGADADPCNTASQQALSIDGLAPDELFVDPTAEPDWSPETFVDGAWMTVSFWARKRSASMWSSRFRLGHPEDRSTARDCRRK